MQHRLLAVGPASGLALTLSAVVFATGCAADPPSLASQTESAAAEDEGDVGDTDDASSGMFSVRGGACSRANILGSVSGARKDVLTRGFTWLDADVPYSQSRQYKGYRTDCSGFVSMAWKLDRSYTTADFIGGGGRSKRLRSYDELLPGDAIVRRSGGAGHVVLFLGWADASKSSACVLEQASTAQDMQFRARSASSLRSGGYKAIRADKLANDTGEPETTTEPETASGEEI